MIEIKNLSKAYADKLALKPCSWNLKKGRAVGLLGPNGAGKSTTIKMITGLLAPTSGSILVDGDDVVREPSLTKGKIGYLPETPPLYPELSVLNSLKFVAGLRGLSGAAKKQSVWESIETLQLEKVALKRVSQLSKGFCQRLGIAQALVGRPPLLILDEPSVGLDPQQVIELRHIIRSLKGDHTIVLSSHVLSEVEQVCDDIVILEDGEMRAAGAIETVLSATSSPYGLRLKVRGDGRGLLDTFNRIPDVVTATFVDSEAYVDLKFQSPVACLDPFLKVAMDAGAGILNIERYQADLEDAYLEATGPSGAFSQEVSQ